MLIVQGAFAYVTEAELMGPGLWINKRAARRILGASLGASLA
jgi:hypothetical protein